MIHEFEEVLEQISKNRNIKLESNIKDISYFVRFTSYFCLFQLFLFSGYTLLSPLVLISICVCLYILRGKINEDKRSKLFDCKYLLYFLVIIFIVDCCDFVLTYNNNDFNWYFSSESKYQNKFYFFVLLTLFLRKTIILNFIWKIISLRKMKPQKKSSKTLLSLTRLNE